MSWASLALTGLKLILSLVTWLNAKQMMKAGEDKAIADAALRVLENTESGKRIREYVRGLDDDAATKLWDDMSNA